MPGFEERPDVRACRVVRFYRHVLYWPIGFELLSWQEQCLRGIFGPVDNENGKRKIRRSYISVAKKQGKSFLVGGLPIFHLLMDEVDHPEAYGAAAAKEQAGIVYRAAAQAREREPASAGTPQGHGNSCGGELRPSRR